MGTSVVEVGGVGNRRGPKGHYNDGKIVGKGRNDYKDIQINSRITNTYSIKV